MASTFLAIPAPAFACDFTPKFDNTGSIAFGGTSTLRGCFNNFPTGTLTLRTNASAGDVVLDNSGRVFFQGNSTGANATITNLLAASFVDFSATTFPSGGRANSAGSIAGTGTFFLGANQLTVGGNNLSTTVSGTIQDGGAAGGTGGSLVKIGTGTLTLSGANSYSGGSTISAGTLQLGDGGAGGSIVGDIVDNGTFAINRSDAFTFDRVISGAGAFHQNGSGTTILTAANSYSGRTTINAGTLQLGNGGTSGSIAGDVVDNSVLAINRSDMFTFDGTISGSGAFQQIGSGTTVLTGNHSYQGSTTVSGGTLQVDGSIAASSGVSVGPGAVLAGNGELGSLTVQSGSTLAPGANAIGALTVSGNLTFQSAAAYLVQVSPTSASSTFVTGSAAIAGTLNANALGGAYVNDQIFSVLSATGPLTGTFNLATTGNFGSATLSLAYSAH